MRVQDVYNVIYTHTEGEPLCIIYSGVPYPANSSILEKRAFLEENYDWLRKANGLVRRSPDGQTKIRFETTAGLVVAEVAHEGDRVLWTRFENVPAYVAEQDIEFELPGYGSLKADLVWGGNYFGIIDLRNTTLRIAPENGSELSRMGLIAREAIREKVKVQHPTEAHINNLNFVTFWHEPTIEGCLYKNVHVFSAGQLDRSPGGTGTSAMMAYFEKRGVISVNQTITSEGLLGSGVFEGCLIGETKLGSVRAVRPTVKGTAGILGTAASRRGNVFGRDRRNRPVPGGF